MLTRVEPLLEPLVAALEGLVGAHLAGIDLERLLEPQGRQVGLEELLLLEVGELEQHLDALALGLDHVELLLEHLDQLRPLLERSVDALEAAQREQVGRVDLEHLAVGLRRLVQIAERRLVETAHAQLVRGDLLRLGERPDLGREDTDQLGMVALLVVDAFERLERRQVQRIDLERALVERDAVLRLAHVAFQELAEIVQDLLAVVRAVATSRARVSVSPICCQLSLIR